MQEKSLIPSDSVFERLRRFRVSQGLTWNQVAKKLGISVSTIMAVKAKTRNLGPKGLHRLEEAEQEVAMRRSVAEKVVEGLIGEPEIVSRILGKGSKKPRTADVAVGFTGGRSRTGLPETVTLTAPAKEVCRKLKGIFTETLDMRLIALACLPTQYQTEAFVGRLTPESRARLTNVALNLVIPDWRSMVVGHLKGKETFD